jgi:hypothetical protein
MTEAPQVLPTLIPGADEDEPVDPYDIIKMSRPTRPCRCCGAKDSPCGMFSITKSLGWTPTRSSPTRYAIAATIGTDT